MLTLRVGIWGRGPETAEAGRRSMRRPASGPYGRGQPVEPALLFGAG